MSTSHDPLACPLGAHSNGTNAVAEMCPEYLELRRATQRVAWSQRVWVDVEKSRLRYNEKRRAKRHGR